MKSAKTILCVDDEPGILHSIERLFHGATFAVVTAANGKEALDKFAAARPDLLILDVNMPVMNGYELLDKIRALGGAEIPVVMLTGDTADDDILKGYGKGVTYYLTKPFANRRLLTIVTYLIGDLTDDQKQKIEMEL